MSSDRAVSADEIIQCYGKHRIDQKKGDSCKKRKSCPWGKMCLSLANESAEDYHYHKANISVGNMLFDPDENKDDSSDLTGVLQEVASVYSEGSSEEDSETLELGNLKISRSAYSEVCGVLVELSRMYFELPAAFDCTMRKIYKGQNQSDVAKEKHITRAGLNKRLLQELGIAQKRNSIQEQRERELAQAKQRLELAEMKAQSQVEALKTMTDAEFAVYKICAEDGCLSATSVAAQTGYSRPTIYAALHNLRTKYGISLTLSPYQRKKK